MEKIWNTMQSKILFFDIDGTLMIFGGIIPESAKQALYEAKANGHKLIICTGRSRAGVPQSVEALPFDGYVCASGGYVEYEGKLICHKTWKPETIERFVSFAVENRVLFHLQCSGKTYVLEEQKEIIDRMWMEQALALGLPPKKLESTAFSREGIRNASDVDKAMYMDSPYSLVQMQKLLPDFEVTGSSFDKEEVQSGEITPKGITKAYGMKCLLDDIGADVADSVAYGDGPNDYEMLEFAGIGVAMGNADESLKQKADMITSAIDEDGIYRSMKALHLI